MAIRIAIAWKECIIVELNDDLKNLPFQQRAIAGEYIYERCVRYALPKVNKLFERSGFLDDLENNSDKRAEFVMLARHVKTGKYVERILGQVRKLLPIWE